MQLPQNIAVLAAAIHIGEIRIEMNPAMLQDGLAGEQRKPGVSAGIFFCCAVKKNEQQQKTANKQKGFGECGCRERQIGFLHKKRIRISTHSSRWAKDRLKKYKMVAENWLIGASYRGHSALKKRGNPDGLPQSVFC
jgi:hypothetical protein